MMEFWVVSLTGIPIILAAGLGYRLGSQQLLLRCGTWLFSLTSAAVVALYGFRAGWYEPLGLITPALLGSITGLLVHRFARRGLSRLQRHDRESIPRGDRVLGSVLGGTGGVVLSASLWLLLLLSLGLPTPPQSARTTPALAPRASSPPQGSWLNSLVRTANRGFVRHLPLVGSLSDEVEALILILNSDGRLRDRLAQRRGFYRLANLPTLRAIADDDDVLSEIDGLGKGNLLSLYRLQRHPKIIAFFKEEAVQELILKLRPSKLIRELEALARSEESD